MDLQRKWRYMNIYIVKGVDKHGKGNLNKEKLSIKVSKGGK